MSTPKPVLIAGAGVASLLLAQALHMAKIPFLVFERDASLVFRAQGYRLRLSSVGLDAIESVLGAAGFQKFYDACGKTGGAGFAAVDPLTGEILGSEDSTVKSEPLASKEGKIVGISRGDMRKLFVEGLEDKIRWGQNVVGYESTDDGVRLMFSDDSRSEEGSMIVGGEGVKSRVAGQLSKGAIKIFDLGARGIHGQAPTTAFKGLGEGVWRTVYKSSSKGNINLITNVRSGDMDNADCTFGWTMMGPPGLIQAPNDDYTIIGETVAKLAKSLTSHWHERVRALIDEMIESEAAFWKLSCSNPSGVPEWHNDPRVTLIGDAVHAMTPAGGNGANTAVRDSALLGRLLAEAWQRGEGQTWAGVTKAYEEEMRIYASAEVKSSFEHASKTFASDIDLSNAPQINQYIPPN